MFENPLATTANAIPDSALDQSPKHIVIIGGGLSGLASAYLLQTQAREQNLNINITLIEKTGRLGGKIWSRSEQGYLCEWGPNGFLSNKPQTLQLCSSLGIRDQLLASNDNARKRFVYAQGKLHKLPHNPQEFIACDLLSWRGKVRMAAELFIQKRAASGDESVADFTRRRLGKEALQKLITPMSRGIFAGEPEQMSLKASFPRIWQLEHEYGGLLKAMLKLRQNRRKAHQSSSEVAASPAGPGGILTSFPAGIEVLTASLANALNEVRIVANATISNINLTADKRYAICSSQGDFTADYLICATPAYASGELLQNIDKQLFQLLQHINYAPLLVVCLGYSAAKISNQLSGFGYLLAAGEEIPVLGTLWESSIFINRAPEGKILLRSMLGGAAHPELIRLSDVALQQIVQNSVKSILGISAAPDMVQIFRHAQAIPAYELGHAELVAQIMQQAALYPNLFITGNAYNGIGINDCVAEAYALSSKVLAEIKRSK